jgi:hypothetical protein
MQGIKIELTSPAASEQSRADCEAICNLGLKAKVSTPSPPGRYTTSDNTRFSHISDAIWMMRELLSKPVLMECKY